MRHLPFSLETPYCPSPRRRFRFGGKAAKWIGGAFLLGLIVIGASGVRAGDRVTLREEMMTNMSGQRPAVELIDEQELAGDPKAGKGGVPKTTYSNGFINANLHYPLAVIFDLGSEVALSDIWYFDANGDGGFRVEAWDEARWKLLCEDGLKQYLTWTGHAVEARSRYVRLVFDSPQSVISEFVLYGSPLVAAEFEVRATPARQRPTMEAFIGLNGFIDDPVEKLAAGGQVREYHSWQWDEGNSDPTYKGYPENAMAWSPSWVSGAGWGWDFDAYYAKLKEAGIEAAPVFQGSARYIVGHVDGRSDWKPISPDEDAENPASYSEHATYLYQFAARYGATKVDPSMLRLREGQKVESGLELVRFMEGWNEPDRTWSGREGHFQPSELAAMMSADYDGNRGTLGPGAGVKTADPEMKFVMAGLAFPEVEYLTAMKVWCDLHREGDFPADVINLHHYSNDAGGQSGQPTRGISPEDDHLREKMTALVAFRDLHWPEKEIWLSEFGYDTHPASPQRASAIGAATAEQVQAWWLTRSYLALAAAGIDRAQMFMLRDVAIDDPGKFNSSGLTGTMKDGHPPKPAWFHLAAMRKVLDGTRFEKEIPSGRDDVRIYRFRQFPAAFSYVDVLWCPTSEGKVVGDFRHSVENGASVSLIQLRDDSQQENATKLAVGDGKVSLEVRECPVFLRSAWFPPSEKRDSSQTDNLN